MGVHVAVILRLSRLEVRSPRFVLGVATAALARGRRSRLQPDEHADHDDNHDASATAAAGLRLRDPGRVPRCQHRHRARRRPGERLLGGTGVASQIAVGTYPDAIAITPDGDRAYVANYTSNSVTPIDLVTGKALAAIHLAANAGPAGIAITPDGKTAYVTDAGASRDLGDTITPIDLATDKTEAPITVGPGPRASPSPPTASAPTSRTPVPSCRARAAPSAPPSHPSTCRPRQRWHRSRSAMLPSPSRSPRTVPPPSSPTSTPAASRRSTSPATRRARPSPLWERRSR